MAVGTTGTAVGGTGVAVGAGGFVGAAGGGAAGAAMPSQGTVGLTEEAYEPVASPPLFPLMMLPQIMRCGDRCTLIPPPRLSRMVLP